jgi:hypothetical protein
MSTDNPASNEHHPVGGNHPALSSGAQDRPRVDHPHAPRFRVVTAVLVGIAVAAIAIAVVVASRGSNRVTAVNSAHWSSWTPDSSGSTAVSEIAQFVAPYYRSSGAQQLSVITPMRLSQATAAGTTTGRGLVVAVNKGTTGSQSLGLLTGTTIAYEVCGLGVKNCELAGAPSVDRMLLLRREALQLALYTFKYISGSQNVVVVLPPGHTVTASGADKKGVTVALVFLRRNLQPWLNVPIARTLQQFAPELSELNVWSKTQEAALVDQVTAHSLFSSQVEALQEGGSALVLTPLPAQ